MLGSSSKMRNYKRKTERGVHQQIMEQAAKLVTEQHESARSSAKQFNIPRTSLLRFLKRLQMVGRPNPTGRPTRTPTVGYNNGRQIFCDTEEKELAEYILQVGRIYYGLSTTEVRKVAFEYAAANLESSKIPCSWKKNKQNRVDWLNGFMKRHPQLAI